MRPFRALGCLESSVEVAGRWSTPMHKWSTTTANERNQQLPPRDDNVPDASLHLPEPPERPDQSQDGETTTHTLGERGNRAGTQILMTRGLALKRLRRRLRIMSTGCNYQMQSTYIQRLLSLVGLFGLSGLPDSSRDFGLSKIVRIEQKGPIVTNIAEKAK